MHCVPGGCQQHCELQKPLYDSTHAPWYHGMGRKFRQIWHCASAIAAIPSIPINSTSTRMVRIDASSMIVLFVWMACNKTAHGRRRSTAFYVEEELLHETFSWSGARFGRRALASSPEKSVQGCSVVARS
jgi:hypothetical protein